MKPEKEAGTLLQKLVEYGINHDKANELIGKNEYGIKMVLQQLEYDNRNGKRIKNPAGYIIKFINDGWIVPEYIEAQIKRHENYPIDDGDDNKLLLTSEKEAQNSLDISLTEIDKYASLLERDSLIQIYKQVFEISKIKETEKLNPETFNHNNPGLFDLFTFRRIKMIFDGIIIDKISEERKNINEIK